MPGDGELPCQDRIDLLERGGAGRPPPGAAAAGWVMFWRRRWAAAAAVVVVALAVEPARADFEWANGAGGQYNSAANWSPTGPPTLVGNASFAVNSTYTVTFTSAVTNDRLFVTAGDVTFNLGGFTATYNQVGNAFSSGSRVGNSAGATLRVKSGTLSIGTFETADFSTYTGTVVVDTGGHLNLTSGFNYFGRDGTSTVTVQNGGDLTTQATYVGRETTATGTVTVTGAGSTWAGSAINVGEGGKGTLNVLAGGQASSTTFTLGGLATGQGTLTVSGAGSSLTASSNASIGFNGTATATVSNGGTATFGSLDIAERPGSAASLTVSGLGAAVNVTGGVTIGGATDALLSNGGTLTVGTGGSFTAGGTMTVRVPGSVNVNGGTLGVAGLVVQSGAAFNFSSGTVQMTTAGSLSDAFLTTVLGPTHRVSPTAPSAARPASPPSTPR